LRNTGAITYVILTRDVSMPKLVIYPLLLDRYSWATMGTYSFCFMTVIQGQILLLQVTKARPDWRFNPPNSNITKHKQISTGIRDRTHKNAATEGISSKC